MDNLENKVDIVKNIKTIDVIKKYKTKNGEVIKVYNQRNYNDTYYKKNTDKFKEKYMCNDCNKHVSKANKHNNEKTKSHILQSKYKIDLKNI
jgi:hypothetical protein